MATISDGVTTITPPARLTVEEEYASRNKVHELLGGGVAVTFGEFPLRTGTLSMFFDDETESKTAYEFFKNGFVFELTDTDVPTSNMFFVVAGVITRTKVEELRNAWILAVDVQEVIQ